MLRTKVKIVTLVAALAVILGTVGCAQGPQTAPTQPAAEKKTITASGSTALQPLVKAAADEFMKSNTGLQINVSGGGSFTGLNQVAGGSVDIGDSDVPVTDELKDKGLVDHQVAVAPFLIIVNKEVTVDNLSQEQLINIFTGKITNWNQVGGKDEKITIIGRAKSSGSRATIKATVLKGAEFTDAATAQDSTGNLITAVIKTPGSIGYIDAAYLKPDVKAVKYNGIEYSPEKVYSGKYPIFAYEHMYTKGEPTGTVKSFIDYIMSADFQAKFVETKGFLSVDKMKK